MENASKALIMAGTILISIMVVSIAVYIINMFGEFTQKQEQERANQQIEEFNAQFLKYEGRNDITAQDIVTVANLAKANNDTYELTDADASSNPEQQGSYYITVSVTSINNNFQNGDKEEFLKDNSIIVVNGRDKIQHYTCTEVIVSDVTKYVSKIIFEKNDIVDD